MSAMSLTSKCDEGAITRWVETEVERELPASWKKFVCMKGHKPIKKLTKYQDPAGINYSNLKSAVKAFVKTKPISFDNNVGDPTLKSIGKRKSLPIDLQDVDEELSPSKRQHISGNNEKLVKGKPKHALSLPLHQESASNKMRVNSNNFEKNSTILGLNKMCNVCRCTGFSSEIELVKHLRSEHLTCNLCNVMYESMQNLQVHMKDQHGWMGKPVPLKMKFQCELCKQKYQTLEFLNKHKLEDHKSPVGPEKVEPLSVNYSCNFCNIMFATSKLLRKHINKKHHESSNTLAGPMLPLLSTKPMLPPGPVLHPADGSLKPSSNYENLSQPGGYSNKNVGRVNKEKVGQVENRKLEEKSSTGINIFPCAECGDEFHRKKDLKKHKKTHKQKSNNLMSSKVAFAELNSVQGNGYDVTEENSFPNDVFEQTDDRDFQDDIDLEENIEVDQSLFVSKTPPTANHQEETEDYYDENEDFEEDVTELEDAVQIDSENWQENEYDEELDQEEYYDIENEHDEIEVISTGINELPRIHDEVEVVQESSSGILFQKQSGYQIQKVQKQRTLNTIQSRYNQITITNNADISDDEDGAFDEEDYSDFSDEELETGVHEEITLDEPEEITLDEDEEIEDIVVISNRKDTLEQDNMLKIEKYETMVANTEFVKSLTENPEKLFTFKQSAWYAQPPSWKPTKLGEVWNATVPQVCFYYKLHDYPLKPEWSFPDWSWEKFDDFMTPLVERVNPGKPASSLCKLKKAKWFLLLDPVIPEELRVTVETLEEEEEFGDDLDILAL